MPREAWVLVKAVVSDTYPDQGLPGPQPPFPGGGGGQPGWPTVPGWPGGSLPGGASGFPHPDNTLPGQQPGIWGPNDPRPTNPIYIPIVIPPDPEHPNIPTHPIYLPVYPDNALPQPQPHPEHPIYMPTPEDAKKAVIKKVLAAIDFWTGNLPESPVNKPTPV